MYNHKLFGPASKVSSILNDTSSNSINYAAFQLHKDMPTAKNTFKYSNQYMPSINKYIILPLTINNSNNVISQDRGKFIQYTPESTMNERWSLLRVDI